MEQKPKRSSSLWRNVLIAAAVGVGVGLILGAIGLILRIDIPGSGAMIGAAIGITFVILNNRK